MHQPTYTSYQQVSGAGSQGLPLGINLPSQHIIPQQANNEMGFKIYQLYPNNSQSNSKTVNYINNDPAINNPLLLHNLSLDSDKILTNLNNQNTLQQTAQSYMINNCRISSEVQTHQNGGNTVSTQKYFQQIQPQIGTNTSNSNSYNKQPLNQQDYFNPLNQPITNSQNFAVSQFPALNIQTLSQESLQRGASDRFSQQQNFFLRQDPSNLPLNLQQQQFTNTAKQIVLSQQPNVGLNAIQCGLLPTPTNFHQQSFQEIQQNQFIVNSNSNIHGARNMAQGQLMTMQKQNMPIFQQIGSQLQNQNYMSQPDFLDNNLQHDAQPNFADTKIFELRQHLDSIQNLHQIVIQPYSKRQLTKRIKKTNSRSSQYRGVSKNGIQWQVQLGNTLSKRYVGSAGTEEEAARIYDKRSIIGAGMKAKTNFAYTKEQILAIIEEEILAQQQEQFQQRT